MTVRYWWSVKLCPRLVPTTRNRLFPYGSCVVKATSLFSSTLRGNCYTIGKSCAVTVHSAIFSAVQIWHHNIPATAFLVRPTMYHATCTGAWMLRIVECMVWLPYEIWYQLQQCYNTINGWYRTMQKYWSTSSIQCIICRQLERSFDLFYYDGLAHQDEVIRLTIGEQWCEGWLRDACLFGGQKGHHLAILTYVWGNCGHENENRGG